MVKGLWDTPAGVRVQRVQMVHKVQRGRWAAAPSVTRKPYNRPAGVEKTSQPRLRAPEMHPFCRLRRRLPRRGRFALRSAYYLISSTKHIAVITSPSGGSTAAGGDRGAFPSGAARLYGFLFWEAEL